METRLIALVLCTLIGVARADEFDGLVTTLDSEAAEMNRLYLEAKNCFPKFSGAGAELCTGLTLDAAETKRMMALTPAACEKEIVTGGYTVFKDQAPPSAVAADYAAFVGSTKKAETWHAERAVLLKSPVAALTCVHELLHVRQRTASLNSPFAPIRREERRLRVLGLLERAAARVTVVEKSGNKKRAQRMVDQLQPTFGALKAWNELGDVLDEKDVHGALWLWCRDNLKAKDCSLEQRDIAIANLWTRRHFIPDARLPEIEADAAKVLQELKKPR